MCTQPTSAAGSAGGLPTCDGTSMPSPFSSQRHSSQLIEKRGQLIEKLDCTCETSATLQIRKCAGMEEICCSACLADYPLTLVGWAPVASLLAAPKGRTLSGVPCRLQGTTVAGTGTVVCAWA